MPDAAAVKAGVEGTNPADTIARQDAALESLKFYINVRAGRNVAVVGATEGVPAAAATRFEEYHRAQSPPDSIYGSPLSPAAQVYFGRASFQLEMLLPLLPRASLQAFASSSDFQEFETGEAAHRVAEQSTEQLLESAATTHQWIAADLSHAAGKQVDMTVFSLPLGEQLVVPFCPQTAGQQVVGELAAILGASMASYDNDIRGDPEPTQNEPCVPQGVGAQALLNLSLKDLRGSQDAVPGTLLMLVQLPSAKCPDWLRAGLARCTLDVTLQDGYVVGVEFPVGGIDWKQKVNDALRSKYGEHDHVAVDPSVCKNALGVTTRKDYGLAWNFSGLRVQYDSLDVCGDADTAGTGWVSVRLESFAGEQVAVAKEREANQPKM